MINDLEKIKEKVYILEESDMIKVTFMANSDSQYVENFEF
jgi:hypothetical protein